MTARLGQFIGALAGTPLAPWADAPAWEAVARCEAHLREWIGGLDAVTYRIDGDIAIHREATVEAGAVIKGPAIIGAGCFVAHGAYLRGGVWLDERCTVGPGAELKTSYVGRGSKLAHFNFVGDSVLGRDVNLEAGSLIANHRNERDDKRIRVRTEGGLQTLAITKFGALVGDGCRIGANAVLAPGTVLAPRSVVQRLALVDPEQAA